METAIEAPTLLIISPNQLNDFAHVSKDDDDKVIQYAYPKGDANSLAVNNPLNTNNGTIVELWHTRMGVKLKNGTINENAYNR